jgi:hypothetical protein
LKVGAEYVVFRLKKEIQEKEKLMKERQELEKVAGLIQMERQEKQGERNLKIVEKQQELKREQDRFEKVLKEFEDVKGLYDKNCQEHGNSAPETHHRGGDCMKCEVF